MIRVDLESNVQRGGGKQPNHLIRIWKIRIPLRKGSLVSDSFKIVACLMTALCIFEFLWIQRLRSGSIRVANDPYDIRFRENIDRNSPSIWDADRQSFIQNAIPVPVHSHNDYSQRIPLFEALGSGCISVEADVHLRNGDLLVGHTASSLQSDSTLRSMYLEPLQRMLEMRKPYSTDDEWRGIFDRAPQQTVVLLIDHKTAGAETFAELYSQLQSLRELDFLSYWNGTDRVMRPLTIVASGNAPFESVTALNATHRDIFWDAKLNNLISIGDNFGVEPPVYAYNRSNSYFASTEFKNARLYTWHDKSRPLPDNPSAKEAAMSQIEQAKERGLVSRYWDTPAGPENLREIAWRVLIDSQVGILNMDDLGIVRARARGWGKAEL